MFRIVLTTITLLIVGLIALTQVSIALGQALPAQAQIVVWQRSAHQHTVVDSRTGVQYHRDMSFNGLIEYDEDACNVVRIRTEPRLLMVETIEGQTGDRQTWDFVLTEPLEIHWTFQAWSPQRRWLTFEPDNGFLLVDLVEGRSYLIADNGANDLIWSPDDEHATMHQDEQMVVRHIPTESATQVIPLIVPSGQIRWSPDGARLAVAGRERLNNGSMAQTRLYIVDSETGIYDSIRRLGINTTIGEFSPTGQYLPFLDARSREMTIVNTQTGVPWHIPIDLGGSFAPVWSTDGRYAVVVADTGRLVMVDTQIQQTFTTKHDALRVYRWLDDTRFIYQAKDQSTHIAQWQQPNLQHILNYPFSGTTGICYPNSQSE